VREQWSLDGDCGIVMGATQLDELARARALVGELPILVPGVGVQGGDAHAVMQAGATKDGGGLIINVGRAILFAQNPEEEAKKYWGECQVNRR
jgi:orotidine-5'-phosphate decarboxylase